MQPKSQSTRSGAPSGVFDDIPRPNAQGKRRAFLLGLTVIAATFGGLGYWAATAPISSAVITQGQIVVSSKRKQVQHLDGGIVRKILVSDGARVKRGDILVELDDADAYLLYATTRNAYFSALATRQRLIAERDSKQAIAFPRRVLKAAKTDSGVADLLKVQRSVFLSRRTERDDQVIVLKQKIAQIEEEINGLEAERSSIIEQKRMVKTELKILEDVFKKGYTTRNRVISARKEVAELTGKAGKLVASIAGAKARIGEAKLQVMQIGNRFRAEIFKELKEVEDRIGQLREKLGKAEQKIERLRIRAPSSGEVVNMQVATVAGVIRAGETVLEIVPADDRLIIEARVRPIDVDHVSVGLDTQVRITAFAQRTTPTLKGKVVWLSPDSLVDSRTGESHYLVRIAVSESSETAATTARLQPGMQAELMIKTGARTTLAYLTQPIVESLNRALRER